MVSFDKKGIEINKTNETRSNGISKMIEEGGLGADRYYIIDKQKPDQKISIENIDQFKDEIRQKDNDDLIDLLILNVKENINSKDNQALVLIKKELLSRV
ncbi:hypothetical protein J3T78_05895 [Staphylococcus nepalensis]|uniref:hypothetical protein n=1 Tax=Staphylococcus nepalensis TaxID=214473 RepID=UPI001A98513D|nr:hypothetical protein [Staphylococcus nepalensis]MBO1217497.1 hypothetical protein [Staphylococcus nepalensis]MBO1237245.1 hypothetical protein [Staphylococcus nepalensis]